MYGWDDRACAVFVATAGSDLEYDHIAAVDSFEHHRMRQQWRHARRRHDEDTVARSHRGNRRLSVGSYGVGTICRATE